MRPILQLCAAVVVLSGAGCNQDALPTTIDGSPRPDGSFDASPPDMARLAPRPCRAHLVPVETTFPARDVSCSIILFNTAFQIIHEPLGPPTSLSVLFDPQQGSLSPGPVSISDLKCDLQSDFYAVNQNWLDQGACPPDLNLFFDWIMDSAPFARGTLDVTIPGAPSGPGLAVHVDF